MAVDGVVTTGKGNSSTDNVEVSYMVTPSGSNAVVVRSGAGDTSKIVGYLNVGEQVLSTKYRNSYYYVATKGGWVNSSHIRILYVYRPPEEPDIDSIKTLTPEEQAAAKAAAKEAAKAALASAEKIVTSLSEDDANKLIYEKYSEDEFKASTSVNDLLVDDLNGVWGMPYQFPPLVDPRPEGSAFGVIYAESIVERMPLLTLSPGKVAFMSDYRTGERQAVLDILNGSNGDKSILGQFISKPGKYYTFEYDSPTYWKYVNSMNRACAIYLGIGDLEVSVNGSAKRKLDAFRWEDACNNKFDSLLISNQSYVCFYADADSSDSESFSNSTTESQLASTVNQYSDTAREVQFLLGAHTGADWLNDGIIDQAKNAIISISENLLNGNALFENITREFAVVASGGKLIFPQIWSDSSFSQTFDVKIKLRCPCPNKVSWYFDICSPLNHLIAMTMPRTPFGTSISGKDFSTEPSANGYMSPFLVRAFYKGIFNCDMGIITSLNITKGKEGSWTVDGLPAEVDVDLSIKDLYDVMAMTPTDQTAEFLNNTVFLNYMANNCGISINKPDYQRSIDLYWSIFKTKTRDKLTYEWWKGGEQNIRNDMLKIYQGIFKS